MNDIKQFKSILKQGISRNTDVLLGCEFLEKLLNIINDYENTKNQLQQKENIIKEVITYIEWLRNEHHKTENLGYTKAVYNTNELLVILHKLRGE